MEVMVEIDLPAIMGDIGQSDLDDVLNTLCLKLDVSDILEQFYAKVTYDEKIKFLDSALTNVDDEDLVKLFGQLTKTEDWNIDVEDVLQSMKALETAARKAVLRINKLKR